MVLVSLLILIFGQTVLISCGTLQSINGTDVYGIVDESLELKWIVTPALHEKATVFKVCLDKLDNVCLASGTATTFAVEKGTSYTERLEAKVDDEGKHVLKITSLKKNLNGVNDDGLKLYITAFFSAKTGSKNSTLIEKEMVIHVRAYPKLLQPLDSSLYFNENERPTVTVTASGIPRPRVAWKFNDDISEGDYTDNKNDTYTYEYTLPELKRNLCGYKLNYTITGWNNKTIRNTSTVIVKFQPKVMVTRTNYTIFVSWGDNKYGDCAPLFTIEVLNATGAVESRTTTSSTMFTFDPEVGKTIFFIRFNTSYHGMQSSVIKKIPVLPTKPTLPPVICKPTSDCINEASDIGAIIGTLICGLIVGLILGSLATYLIIRRKIDEKKGSAIENSNLRPNYEDIVNHGRRNDNIVSCTEMTGVTTSESNYTPLDLSNVQSANYMEINSHENKTYVNVSPQY